MSTEFAPSAPAPTPEPTAAPSQAPDATAAGSGSTPPAPHPVYERALQHIPEAWRAPIVAEFQNIERENQKAIEKARSEATPAEWRQLIAEAQQAGVDPETLVGAYNAQDDFQQRLYADPESFLSDLSTFIESERAAGRITARQAAQQQQQVANAAASAADGDLYQSPEAKQIAELTARLDQDAQERAAREQAEAQRQAEAQQAQEAEAYADQFFNAKQQIFAEVGFIDASGQPILPVSQQQQILYTAAEALERDARLTPAQAIKAAAEDYVRTISQFGGRLTPAQQAAQAQQQIPVLGAGTGNLPAAQAPAPLDRRAKMSEAVRVMREMSGQQ